MGLFFDIVKVERTSSAGNLVREYHYPIGPCMVFVDGRSPRPGERAMLALNDATTHVNRDVPTGIKAGRAADTLAVYEGQPDNP